MADPSRSNSLPPLADSTDIHTLLNPAYSGSLADSDRSGRIRYSTSRPEMVEMNIESIKAEDSQNMRRLKYCVIILFILIGILAIFNIAHFFVWLFDHSSTNQSDAVAYDVEAFLDMATLSFPGNGTTDNKSISENKLIHPTHVILSIVVTTESTIDTTPTSTQISLTTSYEHSLEIKKAYRQFIDRFNRSFSENGLDNYAVNWKLFSETDDSAVLGETQFADLSDEQLRKLLTPVRDQKRNDTSKRCNIHTYINNRAEGNINGSILFDNLDKMPSRADLRRKEAICEVKNQGTTCNAGYAFAVTSLLESMMEMNETRLSVQMLLASDFNHHCDGGETFRAMTSAAEEGIVTEEVLPFDETEKWHDVDANATRYKGGQACLLTGSRVNEGQYYDQHNREWRTRTKSNTTATTYIKQFLAKLGPVVVEVPVDRSFFFYRSGRYSPNCTDDSIIGYQPSLLVGYGMRNGINMWIIRNSFGAQWGIDGDFEMEADSNCGRFDYAFTFYKAI